MSNGNVFEDPGDGFGILGNSKRGTGVIGVFGAPFASILEFPTKVGVAGLNAEGGTGVVGISTRSHGVHGTSGAAGSLTGVDRPCGVLGESVNGYGVFGSSDNHFGITAVSKNGVGLSAGGGTLAAFFRGNVEVQKGDIVLTDGADCAEDFDALEAEQVEPGTVMVIADENGALQQSYQAYDKKVAGVVSGAGDFKPAITLNKQHSREHRLPVALLGKVYCKVDAEYSSIAVGDLLTTSPTQGHAMKVTDPTKAFGAVIGKALRSLSTGQGLIPVLVALQ